MSSPICFVDWVLILDKLPEFGQWVLEVLHPNTIMTKYRAPLGFWHPKNFV